MEPCQRHFPSRLDKLPPEIRLHIYAYVLTSENDIPLKPRLIHGHSIRQAESFHPTFALLLQLESSGLSADYEAEQAFYRNNTFRIDSFHWYGHENPHPIKSFLAVRRGPQRTATAANAVLWITKVTLPRRIEWHPP